jgi:hypothetical protein
MVRLRRPLLTIGAAALACLVVILLSNGPGFGARAESTSQPLPTFAQGTCPKAHMQKLGRDAVARATVAALEEARIVFRGTKLKGARVTSAIFARNDANGRGNYARTKCGARVQNRTVVVNLEFPAMLPSASLSQGVVLVSKFAGEYRVWAQLH